MNEKKFFDVGKNKGKGIREMVKGEWQNVIKLISPKKLCTIY